jgi:hypothetical protein
MGKLLLKLGWFPPSPVFGVGLAVIGLLPAVRGPFPELSLDTTKGTYLYVASVIVVGACYLIADYRERKRQRDLAAESDRKIDALFHAVVELAMSGSAKHDTTQGMLASLSLNLSHLYERAGTTRSVDAVVSASTETGGAGSLRVTPPALSGKGEVTVKPGTGELQIEGFAPIVVGDNVSPSVLDEAIREQEKMILRLLTIDRPVRFEL